MSIENWKTASLGSIAEVIDPHPSHRAPAELKDGIPFPGIGDFHEDGSIDFSSCRFVNAKVFEEHNARYTIEVGDIGFGRVATIGKVVRLRQDLLPYAISPTLAVIKPKEVNPDYLVEFLKSPQLGEQIRSLLTGTTRSSLGIELLRKLVISFPKPNEQLIIGHILSTINRAIEQTKALIAKQQRIKTGLMQDLLTKGIDEDANIRSEETHKFRDSPLGRIPVEWEISSVEKEFNIQTGFTLGEHRRPRKNTHPYLRVANVQREEILLDDLAEIEVEIKELQERLLQKDDLLIVEGHANPAEIGRCAIVKNEAIGLTFQNHLFRLRPKRINSYFCLIWLNSSWVRSYWKNICGTSSGLNTINQKMLKGVLIPVPECNEQTRIFQLIDAQKKLIKEASEHLTVLRRIKTGLMQDLLTGNVRVTGLLDQLSTST